MNRVRGVVDSLNQNGIKIGESWYNFSKFNEIKKPVEGDLVEVVVNDDKWIQELDVVQPAVNGADKQTKITRSGLLNTAIAVLRTQGRPVTTQEVIETAKDFEPYINESPYIPSGDDTPLVEESYGLETL